MHQIYPQKKLKRRKAKTKEIDNQNKTFKKSQRINYWGKKSKTINNPDKAKQEKGQESKKIHQL